MRLFLMPELMWYKSSVLKLLKGNCFDDLTAVIFAANYLPNAFKLKSLLNSKGFAFVI
jgi:hypothetical protein